MIYLNPEVRSGLGEDTFWTWFNREIPSSFEIPPQINDDDVILQYATCGSSQVRGGKKVALLWELYPEMKRFECGSSDGHIYRMTNCANDSDLRVVTSPLMAEYFFNVVVMPIGVDTDLFCVRDKQALREKYGIPQDKNVGFWSGTPHVMKGFDRLQNYASLHPEIYWICVWKQDGGNLDGHRNFTLVSQQQLSELMNCADFALFTGRLRPYFMVEWEAMACNIPVVDVSAREREFYPSQTPRDDVMRLGWSRHQAKQTWINLCQSLI